MSRKPFAKYVRLEKTWENDARRGF